MKEPITQFKNAGVVVTVWQEKNRHGTFYTIRPEREYREDVSEAAHSAWKRSGTFQPDQVPVLIDLLQRAEAFVGDVKKLKDREGAGA